jgi:hypothetical protein
LEVLNSEASKLRYVLNPIVQGMLRDCSLQLFF